MLSNKVILFTLLSGCLSSSHPLLLHAQARPNVTTYRSLDQLLNHEAEASDPDGIREYTESLTNLIVPDVAGKSYVNSFAERLGNAEEIARKGNGRLVPEVDIVRSYNTLLKHIGAPKSAYATDAEMRAFRAHSVAVPVLPALLSADRNGMACNPGEAVYLFYLLLSGNGSLSIYKLDNLRLISRDDVERGSSFIVTGPASKGARGSAASLEIYAHHHPEATVRLFNEVFSTLGL